MKSSGLVALLAGILMPSNGLGSDAFVSQVELRPRVSVTAPAIPQVEASLVLAVPAVPLQAMTDWQADLLSLLDTTTLPQGATIHQQGDDNDALIVQSDPTNRGLIHQSGTDNAASLAQLGMHNIGAIKQSGNGLRGAILQIGNGNSALIIQQQ